MVGGLAVNLVESALSLFAARVVSAGEGGANVPAGVSQIMIASDFGIKPSAAVEQQLLTTSMASDDLQLVRSVPATVEQDTDENESEDSDELVRTRSAPVSRSPRLVTPASPVPQLGHVATTTYEVRPAFERPVDSSATHGNLTAICSMRLSHFCLHHCIRRP